MGPAVLAVEVFSWSISMETLIIGTLTGLAYAVLGAGLVLVYRATRVINFAYGEIGAFGAAVLAKLVIDLDWNFFVALVIVLLLGGAVGAVVELVIVRRLFTAPRLILLVATIGAAQLLFVLQLVLPGVDEVAQYPSPLDRTLRVGQLILRSEHFMVLAFVPAVIATLGYLLTRTPYGIAIRASAENPDRAELVGISTKQVSTLVWVLAGVLATLTAVLVNPLRGTVVGLPSQALGPSLLLRALTAGMLGGLVSLPRTLVGGVLVGIVEAILFVNVAEPGAVDLVLFLAVLAMVLTRRGAADDDAGGWSLTPKTKPVPARLRGIWWIERSSLLLAGLATTLAILLPLVFTSSSQIFLFAEVLLYAMVALSVTVLTGWGGQLSLGQFAFVGLGAMVTSALVDRGMPFGYAVAYATIAGVLAALLIGFPALRVRGLFLAVVTLAFAVAARGYILGHDVFLGGDTATFLPRSSLFGIDFANQRTYYYLCLAVLLAVALMVTRLRRSGIGRAIIAVRDNETAAASFTIHPAVAKLTAFAVAGGIAALAGALLGGLNVQFGAASFAPEDSLQAVAMTVIGGLGSVGGSMLGAIYVVGLPALFGDNPTVGLVTSGVGLLVLLLYLPGGLAQVAYRGRDALFGWLETKLPAAAPQQTGGVSTDALPTAARPDRPADAPALVARDVTVAFGGRLALDHVSVEARSGEVIGLIGSNGAGKSTLMNVISGFQSTTSGSIELFGHDVSNDPPHVRAGHGMGRVFQDARLFSDLTVRDTVKVALEAHEHSELVPSMLGFSSSRRAEQTKSAEAVQYIDFLGLGRYADSFLSDLSTGTRRIVELCCLLAQGSDLLLLDEPTAGVAQKETEAFGPLITRIQRELKATVIIIEHDIPLVMSISDRVYCLAAGRCIAEGLPEDVRHDPEVVAAYLGTDQRAIHRSGTAAEADHAEIVVPGRPSVNGGSRRTEPDDLTSMTRKALLELASEEGLSGVSRLRKAELIDVLEERQ